MAAAFARALVRFITPRLKVLLFLLLISLSVKLTLLCCVILVAAGTGYYGPEIDVWGVGVILYALIYGRLPFDGESDHITRSRIIQAQFAFPPDTTRLQVSANARNLIASILVVDRYARLTWAQIRAHPWFIEVYHIFILYHSIFSFTLMFILVIYLFFDSVYFLLTFLRFRRSVRTLPRSSPQCLYPSAPCRQLSLSCACQAALLLVRSLLGAFLR